MCDDIPADDVACVVTALLYLSFLTCMGGGGEKLSGKPRTDKSHGAWMLMQRMTERIVRPGDMPTLVKVVSIPRNYYEAVP